MLESTREGEVTHRFVDSGNKTPPVENPNNWIDVNRHLYNLLLCAPKQYQYPGNPYGDFVADYMSHVVALSQANDIFLPAGALFIEDAEIERLYFEDPNAPAYVTPLTADIVTYEAPLLKRFADNFNQFFQQKYRAAVLNYEETFRKQEEAEVLTFRPTLRYLEQMIPRIRFFFHEPRQSESPVSQPIVDVGKLDPVTESWFRRDVPATTRDLSMIRALLSEHKKTTEDPSTCTDP